MGSIEAFKIGYFVLGEKAKRSISCNTKTPNKIKMRKKGFEPSRPNGHMRLKHARLPFRHLRLTQNVLYYILLKKGMTKA